MSGEAGDVAPDDNPDLATDIDTQLIPGYPDEDAEVLAAIVAREKLGDGYPAPPAVKAMDRPLWRLVAAATLLEDIASLSSQPQGRAEELRPLGLMFLANAVGRDIERIYRLYHGKRPRYD